MEMSLINGKNKVGLWVSNLGSLCFLLVGIYMAATIGIIEPASSSSYIFFIVFFIIGSLLTLLANYSFKQSDGHKGRFLAGCLGTFFGILVGGVLIFLKN